MHFSTSFLAVGGIASLLFSPAFALPSVAKHPVWQRDFSNGTCSFHFKQYQKNDHGNGKDYSFDIRLLDDLQRVIGGTNGLAIPSYEKKSLDSQLPYTLDIRAGIIDDDPVQFAYGRQSWTSSDRTRCKTGGYEDGNREGDCSFSC